MRKDALGLDRESEGAARAALGARNLIGFAGIVGAKNRLVDLTARIGVMDEALRSFWEPGAPCFSERLACLRHAFEAGYRTSVSAEPLLEPWDVRALVKAVRPFLTHSIWIGKANQLRQRTGWILPPDHPEILRLLSWQTDEKVRRIYELFRNDPLVKWKDSYKKVIGIRRPGEAGLAV
ncbi:MAG: hypothetical protein IMZ44_11955 [Planctomycetes bacterium]|nr:hypothetical protein [Planctomycetota bacterium]